MTSERLPAEHYGEVFTRRWVVETILDLVRYTTDRPLHCLTLVEPSVGSGAFLLPALERLLDSARRSGVAFDALVDAVRCFDIQPRHASRCRDAVTGLLVSRGCGRLVAESLAAKWVIAGDFLLADVDCRADVVVGNPPYIRYDDIAPQTGEAYRSLWSTMRGRGDIYVGFIERALSILRPGGRLGFICADRWMRNQYGSELRRYVAGGFSVEHVWTMHDVDAFEAEVSAYPAVTVIAASPQGEAIVADAARLFGPHEASRLMAWSLIHAPSFTGKGVSAHRLPHWFPGDELWPTGTPARLRLVETLNERFGPLHDSFTGTRVGIGLATGADKAFVTRDKSLVESDRLLPMSMPRDLSTGKFEWSGHYLVNPWDQNGRLVDLDDYPRLRGHLERSEGLRLRHVAKKNPNTWYRTIDKVNAILTERPKLLLQDMRTRIHPVLEPGGYYPHHNLYYVTSDKWDLEVLGGLLLSRVAQAFVEAYCVRMRGGTLRFQAQYLKKIRVPRPDDIGEAQQQELRAAFLDYDQGRATRVAIAVYGIDPDEHDLEG